MELFKLLIVFVRLDPPNDNTRKCAIEVREKVSGAYMGLIYCDGIDEGNEMLKMTSNVIAEEISEEISVTMKRGCSEYAAAYPGYGRVEQGVTFMQYKEEWKIYEDIADERIVFDPTQPEVGETYNRPEFVAQEAHIMNVWLSYAATNGDLTYKDISGRELEPDPSLKRPLV
jgi:hypothetical protein